MIERFPHESQDSIILNDESTELTDERRVKKTKKQAVVVKKKRKLLDNRPNPEQEAAVSEAVKLSQEMDILNREGIPKAHRAGNTRKKQELMGTYSEIEKKLDAMPLEVIKRANTRLDTARTLKKQKKEKQINKIQENLAALDTPDVQPEEKPAPAVEIAVQPEIVAPPEPEPIQEKVAEEKINVISTPPEVSTIETAPETPITFEAIPQTVKKGGVLSAIRTAVSKMKKFIYQVSEKESTDYYQKRGLIDAEDQDNDEIPEPIVRSLQTAAPIEKTLSPEPVIVPEKETPIEVSERDIVAWEGDWEDDERPEGYVDIESLYEAAQDRGFNVDSVLGEGFLEDYIQTVDNAKKGSLTSVELSELISKNSKFHEALVTFKKEYQVSHPRKSRKVPPSSDTLVANNTDTLPVE